MTTLSSFRAGAACAVLTLLVGTSIAWSDPPAPLPVSAKQDQTHAANGSPTAVVQKFDDALLSVMKQATKLGVEGRYAQLERPIRQTFNIPFMTKIVVGPDWNSWTQEQRDKVTAAFGNFIISTYARRFDGYDGESFVVDGERPIGTGTEVMTRLIRPAEDPVNLNYVMRQNPDDGWQIVDVFLTGAISELATRRSEFSAVLARRGYDGLLQELKAKADEPNPDSSMGHR